MSTEDDDVGVRVVGRYAIHGELASGGMASVHLGRLLGEVGFARTVAIKRLHPQYARDPEFVAMFVDEARLVSRIKHPNVVPTLDIVAVDGELFLVMEYVPGEPVSRVMMELGRRKTRMPVNIAVGICLGLLEGLHAAHEAKAEDGSPMSIVHRDVSPQNVIVGVDGVARVLDFGVAKAAQRLQTTEDGQFKGKIGYMPPDVLSGARADRRADIWGATVVLWEMLVGRRLFMSEESPFQLVKRIVESDVESPSRRGVASTPALDAVIAKGLAKAPEDRFTTAREMAVALEDAAPPASSRVIAEWLVALAGETLSARAARVEAVERSSVRGAPSADAVRDLAMRSAPPPARPPSEWPPVVTGEPAAAAAANARGTVGLPRAALVSPRPASARRGVLALLGGLVVTIAGAALVLRGAGARDAGGATSSGSVAAASASASGLPPPLATTTAASSNVDEPRGADAPPSAGSGKREDSEGATGTEPPVSTTSSRASSHPSAPHTAHATPKSCTPPYTIGPPPDYIRKPKLECLPR